MRVRVTAGCLFVVMDFDPTCRLPDRVYDVHSHIGHEQMISPVDILLRRRTSGIKTELVDPGLQEELMIDVQR